MKNIKEINRRNFLKILPKYLAGRVYAFTQECLNSEEPTTPTQEAGIHNNIAQLAWLDVERCLATEGRSCQACYLMCPLRDQAITIEDQRPAIHSLMCDGCAKCVMACSTVNDTPAIKIVMAG